MTATQLTERLVSDVLALCPATAQVFVTYGMGCVGCAFGRFETVREAADAYGLDPDEVAGSLAETIRIAERKSI